MNQPKSALISVIKYLLFLTTLTPLIVLPNLLFPFVIGKMIFFRSIVEIALILFLIYLSMLIYVNKKPLINTDKNKISINQLKSASISGFKNPLFLTLSLFLISLIISVIFAVNPYRAFWGDLERGEGLFGFLHFFAFLIMSVAIFEKKDWLNYLKISLGIGFILIFYAFIQYFRIENIPFAYNINEPRPISLIGNSAFLATHMFFALIFAGVIFFETYKLINFETYKLSNLFWRYFSVLMIILSALTVFLTATRGAILGLGAAVLFLLLYFAFIKKPLIYADNKPINADENISVNQHKSAKISINQRSIARIILALLIIFSLIFIFTRHNEIWQNVPGLNRLAKTAFFDVNDASTQMRLMNWKLSWDVFKQKPLFGWGLENYLIAYEKNYNPNYAVFGETWMDRAHNKIFDLLVMQGAFGLLAYLGIFSAIFYHLYRHAILLGFFKKTLIFADNKLIYADGKNKKSASIGLNQHQSAFIAAAIIGYFVQNLFVMDQLISDFMFFAIIGFIISNQELATSKQELATSNKQDKKQKLIPITGYLLLIPIIIAIFYSLYFYNYIPYVQAKIINEAKGVDRASLIESKLKKAVRPYNFTQFNLRANVIDHIYNNLPHIFQDASFKPLADFFVNLIDEILQKEPYDARMFIRESQIMQAMALYNPEFYKKSEELILKAIEIFPTRQELYYNLSFSLLGQEKFQEAIEIAQKAVELSPKVARAHYHLAFVMAVSGPQYKDEIIQEMEIAGELSPNMEGLEAQDHNIIALVYSRLGRSDKLTEFMLKKIDFGSPAKFLQVYYEESLGYLAATRDAENFIKIAKDAGNSISTLKDDMDVLINLAEKKNWEIMDLLSK